MLKTQSPTQLLRIRDLGLMDYPSAYRIQKQTVAEVIGGSPPCLILCEHKPVFTLGRIATEENFFLQQDEIARQGIDIQRTDRGGEVTFHGPGQLVAYPILDLNNYGRDLKVYLGKLEQVAIDLLRQFGILATLIEGQRGVWVGQRKIVSLGIGVRKWVSFHGLAVNVNTDLGFFTMIRPCGLNVQMTSVAQELGREMDVSAVKQRFIKVFSRHFHLHQ